MFCCYCGNHVSEGMRFCPTCGKELTAENYKSTVIIQNPTDHADKASDAAGETVVKRKKKIWIPILIVALITALLGTGGVVYSVSPSNRYERKLSLGDRYLSELKYDEAITAFKDAIEIDPKNPQGYIKLAEAYVGTKEYEKAMDALHDGYEQTDGHSLLVMEADTCLDYVAILQDDGDLDEAEDVLKERYEKTHDDRLKQELAKIEENRRLAAEEAERAVNEQASAVAEEAPPAEAEEAVAQEEPVKTEDCRARHDELLSQLGEGFDEGMILQNFVFYDENGNQVHVSDFLGKAVYFNFFTTWCPYCFYEIPDMQSVANKYGDDAIVIMIDLGETVEEARQYAEDYDITMPIYYLDSWQAGDLVIDGVPLSIIIDRFGRIQGVHPGMSDYTWMDNTLEKAVKSE